MPNASILYVVTEDWYFWKHRVPLARAARDAGYRVSVAACAGEYAQRIRDEGFTFHPLGMNRRSTGPIQQLAAIRELAALYRWTRPDIVHHVALKPILLGCVAARLAHVSHVVNAVTGLGYVFVREGLRRAILRTVISQWLRLALTRPETRIIFQNPDDLELFTSCGIAPCESCTLILGSGVDTTLFHPCPEPEGPPVILFAARMIWDKGAAVLVEAARLMRQRNVKFRIVLAGVPDSHNPQAIPEETLAAWSREPGVEWIGYCNDMPGLLARSHIVCLPTHYREGIPLALIEAAAAGKPIVTTNTPGCREIVRHERNGLLVPERDPERLAEALTTLVTSAETRKVMGTASRALALNGFSIDSVASRTLDLYASMLETDHE
ncbi:glycosyltransferase involved in cell wall biosynthesis [Desulfobaculum xiamenense]|uniref:Glycosyltransferase involved in cell wall biosynthesis n=1 Tax=Desulfobaculum xiamenense TaxID=995050 RepID=A0A846QFM8_9BACT|nr:glycosyltransferase family 4 protein [Desulfobaculum xiamenense]NJB67041.1 glycosyltransferase involved in cell wall biosynthesis [Desulfobaculum xiamenense]